MPSATLYAVSHVAGTVSTPNNALGAPNGVFTTDANSNTSWASRWRLDTVAGNNNATGTQTVTVRMRKGSNSGNPTLTGLNVWQNGASVASILGSSVSITSTSGQDIARTFSGSVLSGLGAVDIEVVTTGAGGPGSARNAASIDAATWAVAYEAVAEAAGTMAATESGGDTLAASGSVVTPTGVMAVQEAAGDVFAASGTIQATAVSGALAGAEAGADSLAASGAVAVSGTLATTETGADAFAASGEVTEPGRFGVLAVSETGQDALSSAGTVAIAGTLAAAESSGVDTFRASAPVNRGEAQAARRLREKIANSGASSMADMARCADFAMTVEEMKNRGAGMWPDLARSGRVTSE